MCLHKLSVAAILIILTVLPLSAALAGGDDNPYTITSVPREMSYQAILRDSGGDPVADSVYDITFRIFDVSAGGAQLWEEAVPCTTTAGVFTVMFSGVYLPFDVDYWLELEIDSEILVPRQKMGMVGYAAASDTADYAGHVATVDDATGGTISGNVSIQSDLSVDGNIDATGKATIGPDNSNTGVNAFVAGSHNGASGDQGVVGGGSYNSAGGQYSTVSGGSSNSANGGNSTIAGGDENTASAAYSTVGGGLGNTADTTFGTVGGGNSNSSTGDRGSTVAGGEFNTASGAYSSVPGGENNVADGNYSFAAGRKAKANHDGTFVWGDDTDADFASTGDDQFLIRASGGVGIGTNTPTAALHVNGEAKCEVGGVEYFMVPRGAIIMWSGTLASIPSGWVLCNGLNGTPNLSDKFIYGVHVGEDPGATGGSLTVPAHNHTVDIGPISSSVPNHWWLGAGSSFPTSQTADYNHHHDIDPPLTATSTVGAVTNLPPYYKLAFIMKL